MPRPDAMVPGRIQLLLADRRVSWVCALISIVLASPALGVGLVLDDHFHRLALKNWHALPGVPRPWNLFAFVPGDSSTVGALRELGVAPWWTADDLKLAFFRPLSALTHQLDYALFPNSPALMHLHSLLWLGAAVVAAATWYRRMLSVPWLAGLATLFYAIDDAHAIPAAWIANRNALVAATLVTLALFWHDKWRRDGARSAALVAPSVFAVALLAGEAGTTLIGFVIAHAIVFERGVRARLVSIAPYALVTAAWLALWFSLGYGTRGSGLYLDPFRQPVAFAAAIAERGPLLAFGQLSGAVVGLYPFVERDVASVILVASVVGLVALLFIVWPLLRSDASSRFFALASAFSIIPMCAIFPSDRLLLIPALPGLALVARILGWLSGEVPAAPAPRTLALVAGALLTITHGLLAPLLVPAQIELARRVGKAVNAAGRSVPGDLVKQTLVIVSAPDTLLCSYISVTRASEGAELPEHVRCLTVTQRPLEVHRDGERDLVLRPEGGWFASPPDRLFRSQSEPFRAGDSVRLSDVRFDVLEASADGRPTAVRAHFDEPLESSKLVWMVWAGNRYVRFDPPAPGETRTMPATQTMDVLFF